MKIYQYAKLHLTLFSILETSICGDSIKSHNIFFLQDYNNQFTNIGKPLFILPLLFQKYCLNLLFSYSSGVYRVRLDLDHP